MADKERFPTRRKPLRGSPSTRQALYSLESLQQMRPCRKERIPAKWFAVAVQQQRQPKRLRVGGTAWRSNRVSSKIMRWIELLLHRGDS